MDLKEKLRSTGYRHPWEISRSRLIISKLKQIKPTRIIDVGSGDEYLADQIEECLKIPVFRIDPNFTEGHISQSSKRFKSLENIEAAPGDVILLADVLEHVKVPQEFLEQIKIRFQEAPLVLTVPAMQFLYSNHDIFLGHFRRYTKSTIVEELSPFYKIRTAHYFFFSFLIIRIIQKLFFSSSLKESALGSWGFSENSSVTKIVIYFLDLEIRFLKFFPGLSIIIIGH